ncbi:MAG TPA: hypothetical protein VGP73_18555 [Thermoanaerobaculia bacterium]
MRRTRDRALPEQRTYPILLVRVLATPGALAALTESHEGAHRFLSRHLAWDWGDLPEEEKERNALALYTGNPLRSAFTTRLGVPFLIVTEADRSATTICLPHEA